MYAVQAPVPRRDPSPWGQLSETRPRHEDGGRNAAGRADWKTEHGDEARRNRGMTR